MSHDDIGIVCAALTTTTLTQKMTWTNKLAETRQSQRQRIVSIDRHKAANGDAPAKHGIMGYR
jgi:hypothetical protein